MKEGSEGGGGGDSEEHGKGGRKVVRKEIAENTTLFASSVYFSCPFDGRAPILHNSFLDTISLPHLGLSFSA